MTLLALLFPAQSTAQNLFAPASGSPFTVGSSPQSVAVADFNGDGYQDVAIANLSNNNVTVLLGNGSGGFSAASGSPFSAGSTPIALAVGDFNGDGIPDLAVANLLAGHVTVLLGDGSGGFSAASGSPLTVGNFPTSVAVGDFNGDGLADLAVANQSSNNISVFLSNGSGGFTAATGSPISVGSGPHSIAVADLNRDGHLDLAIAEANDSDVTVLLGNGSGGFTADSGSPFATGSGPYSVGVGDFNGDGNLDFATANGNDNNVTVWLGNGSGGFTAATGSPFAVGTSPQSVVVGDFNGDGYADLATANAGTSNVTVLLSNGSGGFSAASGSPFATGFDPAAIAAGNFIGAGHPGLVIADANSNNITVLLNSAPGLTANPPSLTFYASAGQAASASIPVSVASVQTGSTYTATASQTWLQASPLSNPTGSTANVTLAAESASLTAGTYSGIVRFIAPNFFDATTAVTLNVADPSGTLTADTGGPFAVGNSPYAVALADFNGDGHQDLAITNNQSNSVTVLLGDGLGGFTAAGPFSTGTYPTGVAAADFNGDGHPDLAIANNIGTVTVLLGNGSGGFTAAPGSPFAAGSGATAVAVADFNADGHPDLAVANSGSNNVTVLLGNGFGEFFPASGSPFAVGTIPVWVAAADFNGDGYPDLAVANAGSNDVTVLLGNGLGGFTTAGSFTAGSGPSFVTAADFNGDGHPDLAVVNDGNYAVTVLLGNGSGGFTQPTGSPFAVGPFPFGAAVGDINGDGYPDLAVASQTSGNVTVLLGDGLGGFTAASSTFAAGSLPVTVAVGDFNEDGRPDLAIVNSGSNNVTVLLGASASTSSTLTTTAGASVPYGTSVPLTLTLSDSVTAFSSPTGTATFYDGATSLGTASQSASPYTFSTSTLGVGGHTLKAEYSGDLRSLTSTSNTIDITVTQASQTITFTALSNQTFGVIPFTVMATASSGLPVTFTSTTLSVCTYSAPFVTIVGAGTCSLTASQGGNTNYSTAPSVTRSFTVSQASQSITFNPLSNVTLGIAPFTISASASSALPVIFTSTTLTVCTISGSTVTLLAAGTCSITANQTGNTNYSAAPSVTRTFTVSQSSQTITFNALSNVPMGTAPFTISASASSGLPVFFTSTTSAVCTVSGATVTIVAGGTCSITASQPGDISYGAAPSVTRSFTVTALSQTITFNALPNVSYGAAPFTISASASSGLPVTFTSITPAVCTVSGATVAIASPGTCSISASQAGNANYSAAPSVTRSFTVGQASQTINFSIPFPAAYPLTAGSFTVMASASSGLPVSFSSVTPLVCTVSGANVTLLTTGDCEIEASQAGNGNYGPAVSVIVNFVIGHTAQTISLTIPDQLSSAAPFQLQATASSGLPVVFSVVSGPATISGNMLTITGVGTVTVQALQAGNSSYAAGAATATFNIALGSPAVTSVAGAASYASGTVAPGSYAVIFGSSFAAQSGNGNATSTQQLAGATISITDSAGNSFSPDIYYASFGQINFVVPPGIASGPATLTIQNATGNTATAPFAVAAEAPGLFTADSSGKGAPAADVVIVGGGQSQLQPAYQCSGSGSSLACSPTPIPLAGGTQVYLILFGTGIRGAGTAGVSVTIGGVAATVTYAGPQGQYPALDQVNVLVPPALAGAGAVQLILTADGVASNPVTVQFQ